MSIKHHVLSILLLSFALFSCSDDSNDNPEPQLKPTPQELVSGNYNLTLVIDIPGLGRESEEIGPCIVKQSTNDSKTLLLQLTDDDITYTWIKLSNPKFVGQNVSMDVLYQALAESVSTEDYMTYATGDKGVVFEGGVYDALWYENSGNIEISTKVDLYVENEYTDTYHYQWSLTRRN